MSVGLYLPICGVGLSFMLMNSRRVAVGPDSFSLLCKSRYMNPLCINAPELIAFEECKDILDGG